MAEGTGKVACDELLSMMGERPYRNIFAALNYGREDVEARRDEEAKKSVLGGLRLTINIPSTRDGKHAICADALITPSTAYVIDYSRPMSVVLVHLDGDKMDFTNLAKDPPFDHPSNVIGLDGNKKVVIKDAHGLHFFDGSSNRHLFSTPMDAKTRGLALLQNGSLLAFNHKKVSLVIINPGSGLCEKEVRLSSEAIGSMQQTKCILHKRTNPFEECVRCRFSFKMMRNFCTSAAPSGEDVVHLICVDCKQPEQSCILGIKVSDGSLLTCINMSSPGRLLGFPKGATVLPNGGLLVCFSNEHCLGLFDQHGHFVRYIHPEPAINQPLNVRVQASTAAGEVPSLVITAQSSANVMVLDLPSMEFFE